MKVVLILEKTKTNTEESGFGCLDSYPFWNWSMERRSSKLFGSLSFGPEADAKAAAGGRVLSSLCQKETNISN